MGTVPLQSGQGGSSVGTVPLQSGQGGSSVGTVPLQSGQGGSSVGTDIERLDKEPPAQRHSTILQYHYCELTIPARTWAMKYMTGVGWTGRLSTQ